MTEHQGEIHADNFKRPCRKIEMEDRMFRRSSASKRSRPIPYRSTSCGDSFEDAYDEDDASFEQGRNNRTRADIAKDRRTNP